MIEVHKHIRNVSVVRKDTNPIISEVAIGEQDPPGPPGDTGVVTAVAPVVYESATRTVSLNSDWSDPPDLVLLFENAII